MKKRGFEICTKYLDKNITIPIRKTKYSVGYDLESAEDILIPSIFKSVNLIKPNKIEPTLIKTGVKSYFLEDEVLILANKSSTPKKLGLVMANSIGIIESDYYNNESNEGELMLAYYNFFPFDITIKKGAAVGQAYFQKFLIADEDRATGIRTGGFGSTDKIRDKIK